MEQTDNPNTTSLQNGSLDCDGLSLRPNDLVNEITETECQNLGTSTGLNGTEQNNCNDLSDMVCAIKQEVDAIASERLMSIFANDASKCNSNNDPTLASFWSRVLRFSEAITCILCQYDPFVSTILKQGKYPQILMGAVQSGADGTGYPQWIKPDESPKEGSKVPVTSGGVITAVQEALMSVWHLWDEYPEFDYFAQTLNDEDNVQNLTKQSEDTEPTEGDTALVSFDGTDHNVLYTWNGAEWEKTKVLGETDGLTNFAVTHIVKGFYADKGVYYFHDGTNDTWQVMDVDQTELQTQVDELVKIFEHAVQSGDDNSYLITTASTLTEATDVPCTEGKTTIVLVTGVEQ